MALDDLRRALMTAAGSEEIARWHGSTWQAILTRERYGLHFSVSAQRRTPTDAEVFAARARYPHDEQLPDAEVTDAHLKLGAVNPYVRHFVPDGEAERYRRKAGL